MAQEAHRKTILIYEDAKGREPYSDWLASLKDRKTRERILVRIQRLENGLYGDCQPVGEGVLELRLIFGPGYRVYFGEDGERLVVLLCGGDKSSQSRDIQAAKEYWRDYRENG